jgi:hypothetical protein
LMMPWLRPASRATVAMVVSDKPFSATEQMVAWINWLCRSSFGAVRLLVTDLSAAFAKASLRNRKSHYKGLHLAFQ